MVGGIDAEIFRPDDELRRLARRAVDLGVDGQFQSGASVETILQSLRQSGAAGQEWLGELEQSRQPWFNINVGDGFYHYHRAWNDDLTMPFAGLHGYIGKLQAGQSLARSIEQLQQERGRLIAEHRELLSSDEERAGYDQMITLAHRVFPYVEGHKFYCEHWYTNLFFNKIREFGALLAAHGFFADAEDVFQLTHYELESAIIDLMTAWSNGSAPRGSTHWPHRGRAAPRGDARVGQARHAAGARPGARGHRRSGHRHALGHHAREPRALAERRRRGRQQRDPRLRRLERRRRGRGARREVGRGNQPAAARRHPRLPGHQSHLGVDLPEDRRRGVRHRRHR